MLIVSHLCRLGNEFVFKSFSVFFFFLGIVLNYVYLKLLGKNEYSNSFVTYYMYGVI